MIRKQKHIASLFPPFKGGLGRVLGLLLLLLTACIREDRSDCHNTIIRLEYKGDGKESVIKKHVEDVHLYIFNDAGYRLRSYSLSELSDGSIRLNMNDGEYTLITVANSKEHTTIVDGVSDQRNNYYLQHPDWNRAGDVIPTHDHNYIGEVRER